MTNKRWRAFAQPAWEVNERRQSSTFADFGHLNYGCLVVILTYLPAVHL
jgi:hypothetical protein